MTPWVQMSDHLCAENHGSIILIGAEVPAVCTGVCLEGPRWEGEAILLLIQGVSPVESIAHWHLGPCSVSASELGNSE